MRIIELNKGYFTIVDDEDYDILFNFNWRIYKSISNNFYSIARINNKSIFMHRFITICPKNMEVDHKNGDGLDNRKLNLRICTRHDNQGNSKLRKDNSSGFKGVYKSGNKWIARIKHKNKNLNLGIFEDKIFAAKVYNKAAISYFGEYARLNTVN